MIFYHMLLYTSLKGASKENYTYKLNSDDSSNINEVIKRISNLFIFFRKRFLHTKIWRKMYISKYTLKKRLKRKSFIHLIAFYAF